MSVEIWPPSILPGHLALAQEASRQHELLWFIDHLHESLRGLKTGLEACYALLAPIDPGSTLVLTTPRNETVKGHITRVGTRIVKGNISLRMRTLPALTLTIDSTRPIHLAPLTNLHSLLTSSVNLLTLTLSYVYPASDFQTPLKSAAVVPPSAIPPISHSDSPAFLSAQLRLLAQSMNEALTLLKGPPEFATDPAWVNRSIGSAHFASSAPLGPHDPAAPFLSFYLGIQEDHIILWLRALEAADAPVNFGTKIALAIGTSRRLEHDEVDQSFIYQCPRYRDSRADARIVAIDAPQATLRQTSQTTPARPRSHQTDRFHAHHNPNEDQPRDPMEVFVREKLRVASADPSLLSLAAKLSALGNTLTIVRQNLAAAMGDEFVD